MKELSQPQPKIIAEKSDDFKQIFADGAYTWLGPESRTLTFFADCIDPNVDNEGLLNVKTVKKIFG